MAAPQIIYTVNDDGDGDGTTTVNLPTGFTLAQFSEFGAAMATLIDAILGGRVESAEICYGVDLSGLTSNVALSSSDVEEIGSFSFLTTGGFPVKVNVPCIDELTVAPNSDDLDQADPAIAAYIAAMENGISTTGGTMSPTDVAEDDINTTVYARERFRASGTRR